MPLRRVRGYRVYRKEASDTHTLGASYGHVLVYRASGESFTDRTAEDGVAYEYAVAPSGP